MLCTYSGWRKSFGTLVTSQGVQLNRCLFSLIQWGNKIYHTMGIKYFHSQRGRGGKYLKWNATTLDGVFQYKFSGICFRHLVNFIPYHWHFEESQIEIKNLTYSISSEYTAVLYKSRI